jgi:hypothetical protein
MSALFAHSTTTTTIAASTATDCNPAHVIPTMMTQIYYLVVLFCFACLCQADSLKKTTQSTLASLHTEYRDTLLRYYEMAGTMEGKDLFGLIDKPVPKLPPFVRHSGRMWLIW